MNKKKWIDKGFTLTAWLIFIGYIVVINRVVADRFPHLIN